MNPYIPMQCEVLAKEHEKGIQRSVVFLMTLEMVTFKCVLRFTH